MTSASTSDASAAWIRPFCAGTAGAGLASLQQQPERPGRSGGVSGVDSFWQHDRAALFWQQPQVGSADSRAPQQQLPPPAIAPVLQHRGTAPHTGAAIRLAAITAMPTDRASFGNMLVQWVADFGAKSGDIFDQPWPESQATLPDTNKLTGKSPAACG